MVLAEDARPDTPRIAPEVRLLGRLREPVALACQIGQRHGSKQVAGEGHAKIAR
jgi:hypothetical protein